MQEIQTLLLFSPTQQVVRGNHHSNCCFNLIDIMAKKARFLQKENNSDSCGGGVAPFQRTSEVIIINTTIQCGDYIQGRVSPFLCWPPFNDQH